MKTRGYWGMLVFAGLFAVTAILVAVGTYFYESSDAPDAPLSVTDTAGEKVKSIFPDTDGDGIPDWQENIIGTNPQNPDTDYDGVPDGAELSQGTLAFFTSNQEPTDSFADALAEKYAELSADGPISDEERNVAIDEFVATYGAAPSVYVPLTMSSVRASSDMSVETYAPLLVVILKESANVKEHELTTFRRSIEMKNYSGTSSLREAGVLYKSIQEALIAIDVPPELASEHLAVVNSIGSLAGIVTAMSAWNGDSITGIVYVNAFVGAEAQTNSAIETIFAKIASLIQQT